MAQADQTASEQVSDELERTSAPNRYIPWIPLLALTQLIATVTIFAGVVAPYVGNEQPVAEIHDSSTS